MFNLSVFSQFFNDRNPNLRFCMIYIYFNDLVYYTVYTDRYLIYITFPPTLTFERLRTIKRALSNDVRKLNFNLFFT